MSPADSTATIIVVGDALVSDLIEAYLHGAKPPIGVIKATSVAQALAVLESPTRVHLALFDWKLPEVSGLSAFRELRKRYAEFPVAVLSGEASAETVRVAIEAGACGFVSSCLAGPAFVAALRLMLAGEMYFPPALFQELTEGPRSEADGLVDTLTPRELETLKHLSRGRSNKEIARAMNIEIVTVTLHLTNLYRKLRVSGRVQAVRRAVEAGVRLGCS